MVSKYSYEKENSMKKKNKLLIISIVVFAVIGLVCLGLALGIENIGKWFISSDAIFVYVIAGLYVLTIGFVYFGDVIKRL